MNHFKKIITRYRTLIIIYLLTGLFTAFLENFSAQYYQTLIDGFTSGTLTFSQILIYGSAILALCIISYLDEYPDKKLSNSFYYDFKMLALKKISRISYREYQTLGTGRLIQQIEAGAAAGKGILFHSFFRTIRQLLPSILFSLFFMLRLNPAVTYIILAGYIIVFLITHLLLKTLYRLKEKILDNEEQLNHLLTRGFMEMIVFRISGRFTHEIRRAEKAKDEITEAKVKMNLIHEAFFTIFAILITGIKIGILLYAWRTRRLSIGTAIALITLVENAYTPIAIFNVLYVEYKLDKSSFARFARFLEAEDDHQLSDGKKVSAEHGDIVFSDVTFYYGDRIILDDISVTIKAGSKIALVGESGSGKSTFVKLLSGLLKPDSGDICVFRESLSSLCLSDYYRHLSYISQESPVFDGTLRENLLLGCTASEQDIIEVLKKTKLYSLYKQLPAGLETPLGEKGLTLSGGERQRLALARLWFSPSHIIIMDESTSAMDNLTEQSILQEVFRILEGKTVISIAHRLHSVQTFERLLVFRNGQLAGDGSFQELLCSNTYFRNLYTTETTV